MEKHGVCEQQTHSNRGCGKSSIKEIIIFSKATKSFIHECTLSTCHFIIKNKGCINNVYLVTGNNVSGQKELMFTDSLTFQKGLIGKGSLVMIDS